MPSKILATSVPDIGVRKAQRRSRQNEHRDQATADPTTGVRHPTEAGL
jgi:hypothetical protein